jgi:hypothetical protein
MESMSDGLRGHFVEGSYDQENFTITDYNQIRLLAGILRCAAKCYFTDSQ